MTLAAQNLAEQKLAELWAQDEPAAHDASFVLAAMERVERRRLIEGVLALAPLTAAAVLVFWALAPVIAAMAQGLGLGGVQAGPLIGAVVMALFLWAWVSDRLQPLAA
jgi:hypothetical protein